MACIIKTTVIAAALLTTISTVALTGDYYPPEELDGTPGGSIVEFGTGWYLRGDVGGDILIVDPSFTLNDVATGNDLGRTGSIGLGAGYRINQFMRVDATVDQFMNYDFSDRRSISCGTWDHDADPLTANLAVAGNCNEQTSLSASATVLMVNAYLDIENSTKFTPYIGVGAGMAYLRWSNYVLSGNCVLEAFTDCGAGTLNPLYSNNVDSNSGWKPAASAMVGFSYDISDNLKLDAGYKFTYIAGDDVVTDIPIGATQFDLAYESFNIHQVRIGLRYEIW